jgi:tetrahydromethanopterin S-methyltransferase subunit F
MRPLNRIAKAKAAIMLTHIGALVGYYCGNPRDPQIAVDGFFCGSLPFETLLAWRDLRGHPHRQTHDLPESKKIAASATIEQAVRKNLYNAVVYRAGFIGRPEKANLCTDSTRCAGRTGGGIAIGTSYCCF